MRVEPAEPTVVEPTAQERADALRALANPDRLRAVFGSVLYRDDSALVRARNLCTMAGRLLRCEHVAVNLLTSDQQITVAISAGSADPNPKPVQQAVCQYVTVRGQSFIIVDAEANLELDASQVMIEAGMRCYLGVPLVHDGQVIGALCAYGGSARQWTLDEVRLLQAWAEVLMSLETPGD